LAQQIPAGNREAKMPQPIFRGIHLLLDGRVSRRSKIFFLADNIEVGATIKIERSSGSGTHYKWTGRAGNGDIKLNGRVKMFVTCDSGDSRTIRRGRNRGKGYGAGDIIDVTFTITNPASPPVDSPEIVGIE